MLAADPSLAPQTALPSFTFSTSIAHVAANREKRLSRVAAVPAEAPVPRPPRRKDEDKAFKAPKEARVRRAPAPSAPPAARPRLEDAPGPSASAFSRVPAPAARATRSTRSVSASTSAPAEEDGSVSTLPAALAAPPTPRKSASFTPSLTGGGNTGRTIYSQSWAEPA